MPAVFGNRIQVATATTGTGNITLGAAEAGYQTFADGGVSNGDTVRYLIVDGVNWEIGTGTYTASGTVLVRSAEESTNSDSELNLSGSAVVSVIAAAADFEVLNSVVPKSGGTFTGDIIVNDSVPVFTLLDSDDGSRFRAYYNSGLIVFQASDSSGAVGTSGNFLFSGYSATTTDVGLFQVRHSGASRDITHEGNLQSQIDALGTLFPKSGGSITGNVTISGPLISTNLNNHFGYGVSGTALLHLGYNRAADGGNGFRFYGDSSAPTTYTASIQQSGGANGNIDITLPGTGVVNIDGETVTHEGNLQSQIDALGTVVKYGSSSGQARLWDPYYDKIPIISAAGVIDIGRYLDGHNATDDVDGYSSRLEFLDNGIYITSQNGDANNDLLIHEGNIADYANDWTVATVAISGGQYNLTGIPSGVTEIEVFIPQVVQSATSYGPAIRIGDSGGIETTGYLGDEANRVEAGSYNQAKQGCFVKIVNVGGNKWLFSGTGYRTGGGFDIAGFKELTAELDRIQIYPQGGTWNAGSSLDVIIRYK